MKKQRIFITAVLLLAALWGAPRRAAAQIFAVRANALAVCSATLNAGAEAALTDNWSLELSGYWNPVQTASLSMNFHAVQLGGRYWFYESFVGHFLGQHLPMSVTTSEAGQNAIRGMPAVWVSATGMRGCSRNAGTSPSKPAQGFTARRTRAATPRSETGTTSISTVTDAGRSRRQS